MLLPDAVACIGPLVACWWVRRGIGKGSVVRTFLCHDEPHKTEIERRYPTVQYFRECSAESKREGYPEPQRFLKGSGGRSLTDLTYTMSCIDPTHSSRAVGGAS